MKVVTVVGARPQFIKCGPVSKALRREHVEVLVHTGQHYDDDMSAVFFRDLGIPRPEYNLNIGSGSHAIQTGAMMRAIEDVLVKEDPDCILVYGDTNSTLAGALAAVKIHIPVVHVEAGLRSFNRQMPEEVNRVLTDHISDLLLCPTPTAVEHLRAEGIRNGVHLVGDVMFDALLDARKHSAQRIADIERLGLTPGEFYLITIHRAENTGDEAVLRRIVRSILALDAPVVLPLHPRTRKALERSGLMEEIAQQCIILPPQGYFDFIALLTSARALLTDSGGAQKEAFLLGVPCVTLREETEWVETVQLGRNRLAGTDPARISDAVRRPFPPLSADKNPFGDGYSAARIVQALKEAYE